MSRLLTLEDVAKTFDLPIELLSEVDLDLDQDEAIPCYITEVVRPIWCATAEDHKADWEVLYSCGCALAYCDHAYRTMIEPLMNDVWECDTHGMVGGPRIVVCSPLRRGGN